MTDCDRCGNEGAEVTLILARDLDDPGTKMALCDDCGASATFMIGDWLDGGWEYDVKWAKTREFAEWVEKVERVAKKLGITTPEMLASLTNPEQEA